MPWCCAGRGQLRRFWTGSCVHCGVGAFTIYGCCFGWRGGMGLRCCVVCGMQQGGGLGAGPGGGIDQMCKISQLLFAAGDAPAAEGRQGTGSGKLRCKATTQLSTSPLLLEAPVLSMLPGIKGRLRVWAQTPTVLLGFRLPKQLLGRVHSLQAMAALVGTCGRAALTSGGDQRSTGKWCRLALRKHPI